MIRTRSSHIVTACQPEVSPFLFRYALTLSNLYCLVSLLLKRIFTQNCVQNLSSRVQKTHLRLACVAQKTSLLKLLKDLKWPLSRVHFRLL